MSEEKIASVVRDFVGAYMRRDVDKVLSFLAEDVVWVQPEGALKGKEEVKRTFTFMSQKTPELRIRDAGIGILVKGNRAIYEWVYEGSTSDGRRFREIPGITMYEFSEEKIQQYREYYDRLSMAKQVAKGWFEKTIVGTIVNRWEKGFH